MSDDYTVKLIFSSEGVPRTVGDVQKINKQLEEAAKQNKALAVEASQLAGLFNLSGREAADVKAALEETADETEEAVRAARILAEVYGLSADEVAEVEEAVRAVTEESKEAKKQFETLVAAGATALTATIGVFLDQAVNQFSEFEQFENVLQNTFGDPRQVEQATQLVSNFADQSALDLKKTEDSYSSLISRGIEPTAERLRQLADISVSQGKEIDQLVEAILDAQTGENERLKEFGIAADATGKQLELTFQGVTVAAEKTPEAIADAIFGLGDLQGVAGSATSRVETLEGRLTLLSNESTRASRTFGELVASGFEPVIISATELLTRFNSLPDSVQSVVVASTALVGALSAAVAAVTAYNLAGGKAIVQQALTTIALGKTTVAQVANTVSTQAATAAQSAYAVATGTATAAQQAQIGAIVGAGAALAAFTGALAAVGLAVDTFLTVTEEARKTDEQIKILRTSIESLDEVTSNPSGAEGIIALQSAAAEATANVEALQDRLGVVQRFLDGIRGFEINGERVFFDATAAEASINQTRIKFAELSAEVDEIILRGAQAANALEDGVTLPPGVVENTVASIDAATAALEAQAPVTNEAIQRRDAQIEKLEEYRERIISTTEGLSALGDSTEDLKNRLQELNDTLDIGQLQIQQTGQAALAALEEQRASGLVSSDQYQTQLAAIERAGFDERITLANDKLAELRELERATTDEEALVGIQEEILKTQIEIDRDRTASAKIRTERVVEAEREEVEAAKKAAKEKTEALKKERDEQERIATEAFDTQQRQQSDAFDEQERQANVQFDTQQRRAEERFNDQQREEQQRFEDGLRSESADFENSQRAAQRQFEDSQQSAQRRFNDQQRSDEEAFQKKINDERQQGNANFDALEAEVDNRVELAQASTREERKAIEDRIEAEKEAAEIRRDVEADVLRQQRSILSDADTDLSPLEQARADFESGLQEKEAQFQEQQRLNQQAFDDNQRLAAQAFDDEQRIAKEVFDESQRQLELLFQEEQREAEAAFQDEQRIAQSDFADEQRTLQKDFEDAQRLAEATFKDNQRTLDEDSAKEIKRILDSANNVGGVEARREGGPVKSGQPYLVGEDGPELIFPSRAGYVATAGQTAKLLGSIRPFSLPDLSSRSLSTVEKKLDRLIKVAQENGSPRINAGGNTYNISSQSDPTATAQKLMLDQIRSVARGL